ncbi:MAG: hypothetical protein ACTSYC_03300 [Promethearchaeota archaeon]
MTRKKTISRQLKEKIKTILFPDTLLLKNQEPPKSFSFEKKFFGLYVIFLFYSFILLFAINNPENIIISFFTVGNPFAIANSLIIFYLILSLLYSNNKVREFIFLKNTAIKQICLYIGIFIPLFLLFAWIIGTSINLTYFLLTFSMIWLFIYSSRFYIYSRKFSTKIESRIIRKYSIFRNLIVTITPFLILAGLVFISWLYRAFLVYLSLDFLATFDPNGAILVYYVEMRIIMPLIYFSLVITMVFVSLEYVFTRRKAETRRAGIFDNFTFSFIVFFIFFFQLMQLTVYLLLRPETINSLKNVLETTGTVSSFIFFIEFGISMFFLYRVIYKTGRTLGWQILFFKKDGLILFMLSTIFAQTTTRFSLSTHVPNQEISGFGLILLADKYIISIIMILFLGITLLLYYVKPHETSMFLRMEKELIDEEERTMDTIYKFIRNEYIRRGESFPLEAIEHQLMKTTRQSKAVIRSLLKRLTEKDLNIELKRVSDETGKTMLLIDFLSITEQFEKKKSARKKAQKFLSDKLIHSISNPKPKEFGLKADLKSDKATDQFIASLSINYKKKLEEEEKLEKIKELKTKKITFKEGKIPESLKEQILDIIKKEYIFRIENPGKYPEYYIPISEIAFQIELQTKITPGDLFPILEKISRKDIELELIRNPNNKEDKLIKIIPIADDSIALSLESFRPNDYNELKKHITNKMLANLKRRKSREIISRLIRKIESKTESQKAWKNFLSLLDKEFPDFEKELKRISNHALFSRHFDKYIINREKASNT